ncbi:hypothetical protein D3C78_1167760 [compost metagenome]
MAVDIAKLRLEGKIKRDRNQQERHDGAHEIGRHEGGCQRAEHPAGHGHQRHRQLFFEIHMAASGIGKGRRGGTKLSLQLVRAERIERGDAHDHHCGNDDEATTTGDGIDKSGKDGDAEENDKNVEGDVLHWECPGRREERASSFTERATAQSLSVRSAAGRGIAVLPLIVMFPWRVAGRTDGA